VGRSIGVFGLGYVGSVTAAYLASRGHNVIGIDLNPTKVQMLAQGCSSIVDFGMQELVDAGRRAGTLSATVDAESAVSSSEISFICVGTPGKTDGSVDLENVERVVQSIGRVLRGKESLHTIVVRSTLMPGTTESRIIPLLEEVSGRKAGKDFEVLYNPEFLREGTAPADYLNPPFTVIGSRNPGQAETLLDLYQEIPGPRHETSIVLAEMLKYASNAFHALKVSFANELSTLCGHVGVEVNELFRIFSSDSKLNISSAYLTPGAAFGGPCLIKDLTALLHEAGARRLDLPLLQSILVSNSAHIQRTVDRVLQIGKRNIAVLGISFKPGTDDVRGSPQVTLIRKLIDSSLRVRAWDPEVSLPRLIGANRAFLETAIPEIADVLLDDLNQVIPDAEVVIIASGGISRKLFRSYLAPNHIVIDLVNLSDRSNS
jgi:GDP-mannose 6-dehydrogenase